MHRATIAFHARDRVGMLLAALSACLFLLFQEGAITVSDGDSMFQVTRSIVEEGDLTVPAAAGVPGRDGAHYSKYAPGMPILGLGPYLLTVPLARASGRADTVARFAVASLAPLLAAALVWALYRLARRLGAPTPGAAIAGFGAVAGTFALPSSKEFLSEPLAAIGITLAIDRLLAGRPAASGVAVGVAALARPQSAALAPVLMAVAWRRHGARGVAVASVPLAVAGGILGAYNWARFGNPLNFGYTGEGFTTPLVEGAWNLIAHPDKSVLLFAPVIVLTPVALARIERHAAVLLGANFIIAFVLAATWHSWAGGWSWGPRLLLPGVLPLLAAVPLAVRRSRPLVLALVLGFAVSAPALMVSVRAQQLDAHPGVGPSVVRQYELVPATARYTVRHIGERGDGDHRRYLALWQANLAGVLGAPGAVLGVAGSLILIAGAAVSAARLRRAVGGVLSAGVDGSADRPDTAPT